MNLAKLFLPLLALGFSLTAVAQGDGPQTGNGVIFLSEANLAFPPTPVDSTSTLDISLYNDVGAEQTINLTGLSAPFSTPESAITIPAFGTVPVSFDFLPTGTGTFNGGVTAQGNIFGEASLTFSGTATLADYTFTPDTVHLGVSPVSQTNTGTFAVSSTGDGPIGLSNGQSSHPAFSVSSDLITIDEGSTANIPITFYTEQSGNYAADITFETNAPQSPTLTIHVTASAITEVSGDVCGTWTLDNSPYTLVGDVNVASNCSLIVEAGVEILGAYDIIANGPVHFEGTEENPIYSESRTIELLQADTASFTHTNFTGKGNLFTESFETTNGINEYNNNSPWENNQYWTCLDSSSMNTYDLTPNYNGPSGCDYVYRESSCHAFSGSYYYRFSSVNYSGTLLSPSYTIPKSGEYNFSMSYVLNDAERNCAFLVGYTVNDGDVIYKHSTLDQHYNSWHCNRGDHFAEFQIHLEAGDELRIILTNHISSTASDSDQLTVYVDALRLDWMESAYSSQELAWLDSSAWTESYVAHPAQGDSLLFAEDESGDRFLRFAINYNYARVSFDHIAIENGYYALEWEDRVPVQGTNKEPVVWTNSNGNNSWYEVHRHYVEYSSQYEQPYLNWRKHIVNLGYTSSGNVIRVKLENYDGNTGNDLEWHLKNFRLRKLSTEPRLNPQPNITAGQTDIAFQSVSAPTGIVLDTAALHLQDITIDNPENHGLQLSSVIGSELNLSTVNIAGQSVHDHALLIEGAEITSSHWNAVHVTSGQTHGARIDVADSLALNLTGCTVSNHGQSGLQISSSGSTLSLDSTIISDNEDNGLELGIQNMGLTLSASEINGNGSRGILAPEDMGDLILNHSSISHNGYMGLHCYGTAKDISLSHSAVNDNSSYGLYFNTASQDTIGDLILEHSLIQANSGSGGIYVPCHAGGVSLTHVRVSDNDQYGIRIERDFQSLEMDSVLFENNVYEGFYGSLCLDDSIHFNKVETATFGQIYNDRDAIEFHSNGASIILDSCTFRRNIAPNSNGSGSSLRINNSTSEPNQWVITDCVIENNAKGIYSNAPSNSLLFKNNEVQSNGIGVDLNFTGGDIDIESTLIASNINEGIYLNGILDSSTFLLRDCLFDSNEGRGLHIGGTSSTPSTALITENTFQNNAWTSVQWGVNGDITVFDNDAHDNTGGYLYYFPNSQEVNLTLSRDTISSSDYYLQSNSNTTAIIDSIALTQMRYDGLRFDGSNHDVTLTHSVLNGDDSFYVDDDHAAVRLNGELDMDYCLIRSFGSGIWGTSSLTQPWEIDNSLIAYNHGYGILHGEGINLNYSSVIGNGSYGILGSGFSTISNSLVWFNGYSVQIGGSTYAIQYSNVQGINAQLTSEAYAWGDGCIGTDPVLTDSLGHYDPYSPCVDGGMPWEQDAHIPAGQGSSRADMGLYGGPSNAYWGGVPPPDGAVVITDLFDIPQDQGGKLGMHFDASPFDFGGLGFNVSHYSIWRDLALGSDAPTIVGDGNWEQIGTVPAQGFAQYGYTAETLVNATPGDTTCLSSFIVIAHTNDDNIYWVSEVAAACSYDNLAPAGPELDGEVLLDEPDAPVVLLSWPAPEEDDYAYTVIVRNDGVETNVVGDTLLFDLDVSVGETYEYLGYHIDMNGNPSDTASVVLSIGAQRDVIPLSAGWNLVSLDRTPLDADVSTVMAELMPGNLLYVTGFDAGATFFDPTGLPFLNTLSALEDGYGYWIKVAADDTLRVEGASLAPGTLPTLDAGWNLVAYTAEQPAPPSNVFANLLANDELVYVTGFDGGVSIYDPAGLPFLNTLTAMDNGFGYWVKTTVDYAGLGLVDEGVPHATVAKANPAFDFVNGISDLGNRPGAVVDIIAPDGTVVGRLDVLSGGVLMTTAVYGDDPTTDAVEGLQPGDVLHFALDGRLAVETVSWEGNMGHLKLDLHFGTAPVLSVFPNPVIDEATVQFELTEPGHVRIELLDATGRVIDVVLDADRPAGEQRIQVDFSSLPAGWYTLSTSVDNRRLGETQVQLH